jgi:hypothetical protein
MMLQDRQAFVVALTADFQAAKASNSQDVAVWMNLAKRYMQIGANMNWAFCVQKAQECRPVTRMITDLGVLDNALELALIPVAMETEVVMLLNAYWVQVNDDDCGMFIHAESRSQAKTLFLKRWPFLDNPEWIDLRARRCRGLLDDVPFTDFSIKIAGYGVGRSPENGVDSFLDYCHCPMCEAEKAKSKPRHILTDLGMGGQEIALTLVPVDVGTVTA